MRHTREPTAPEDEVTRRARGRLGIVVHERWHLDSLLGVGGMAAVYAATHRNNGKRVAIKMLHPELSTSAEIRQRFINEGYAANRVAHPGAVSVLDDDVAEDGAAFLVMELLEGETLEARLRRVGRLDPLQVLSITDALLDVLAAAHAQGIVHRDIKPDNIFITTHGVVMLLDFGIARMVVEGRPRTTISGATMGTPAFMAPEQARGRWEDLDGRTDLWAVGATMFVQLTGRVVHEAETTNEELLAAMTKPAPSLGDVAPHLPRPLIELVDRALAFEQQDRWDDALCMQSAVRAAYGRVEAGDSAPLATPAEAIHSTSPHTFITPHQLVSNTESNRNIHLPVTRNQGRVWGLAALAASMVVAGGITLSTGRPSATAVSATQALPQTILAPLPPPDDLSAAAEPPQVSAPSHTGNDVLASDPAAALLKPAGDAPGKPADRGGVGRGSASRGVAPATRGVAAPRAEKTPLTSATGTFAPAAAGAHVPVTPPAQIAPLTPSSQVTERSPANPAPRVAPAIDPLERRK